MKIFNKLLKWKTENFTKIPLFYITFDYQKFIKNGAAGSCDIVLHPEFNNDELLKEKMFDVIDYIRNNYDMNKFTEI